VIFVESHHMSTIKFMLEGRGHFCVSAIGQVVPRTNFLGCHAMATTRGLSFWIILIFFGAKLQFAVRNNWLRLYVFYTSTCLCTLPTCLGPGTSLFSFLGVSQCCSLWHRLSVLLCFFSFFYLGALTSSRHFVVTVTIPWHLGHTYNLPFHVIWVIIVTIPCHLGHNCNYSVSSR
jgi:hypothetical protein